MRNQLKNKRLLYIARLNIEKGSDDYGNPQYDDPYLFKENLAPVDGDSEIAEFGSRVKKMYKSTPSASKWRGKIKEDDRAYLDGVTPDGEKVNGSNANYRVESVRETVNTMTIYFEKLP